MNSMTGYGKSIIEKDGVKLIIEVKSVNHRFLDLSFKLPRVLNFAEDVMRKIFQKRIARGHIDVFTTYQDNRTDKTTVVCDESLANNLINIAKIISEKYGIVNDYSVSNLLRYPDVLIASVNDENEEFLIELVKQATNEAIDNLLQMRVREGAAMKNDITARLANIKSLYDEIFVLAPLTVDDYKQKIKLRITEMLEDVAIDETKLINEVAFFTDKCNIDEELARLKTHIEHFNSIVEESEPVGRKMDFLVQELNREINTIGSKANDIKITNCVVKLKNELEKIREQVQNIE